MALEAVCELLERACPTDHTATVGGWGLVKVQTPLVYPTGGLIDVFVQPEGSGLVVSDLGETAADYTMSTGNGLGADELRDAADCVRRIGVSFSDLTFQTRCGSADALAGAVFRVAAACYAASGLWSARWAAR